MRPRNLVREDEAKAWEAEAKVALLATRSEQNLPHITLLTTLQANGPHELVFGEFCRGLSKINLAARPEAGFLILSMDRKVWRGKARWKRVAAEGAEYKRLNDISMFKYNSYFRIGRVHYLDLVAVEGGAGLPLPLIVPAMLATRLGRATLLSGSGGRILTPWAESLFNNLKALKFLAWVRPDGYPRIVPLLQCQAAGSRRLVFWPLPWARDLMEIPRGAAVAIYGLTMEMESVLVRGRFAGFSVVRGGLGTIDLNWVYNSMPPSHGQIYPCLPLRAVEEF